MVAYDLAAVVVFYGPGEDVFAGAVVAEHVEIRGEHIVEVGV